VTLVSVFTLGFLLGMRHAADADHIAAVATLATRSRSVGQTILQGAAWGTGHTLTLMVFGGAVLAAGLVVPERAAQALELAVGVMLVALGADALYRLWRKRVHFHAHRHTDGAAHFHAHAHRGDSAPHDPARHDHAHPRGAAGRALLVGMMHGLAGSAALILLGLEAMRSPALAFAYIAVFGVGSIIGMLLLSAAIAVPLRWSSRRLGRAHHALSVAVGLATLVLGCYIVFSSPLA
jgi:ABC-type nickel/cobalt efflux system permease component RcnA